MVLSYKEPPFDELMRTQQATWDSVEHPDVRTVYYYGGGKGWVNEKEFSADADDLYYRMHWKLALALKEIGDLDNTLVFRTNSSSAVSKKNFVEFAKTLPTEKLYCGWTLEDSNYDGGLCVSGSGMWLSPDCIEMLKSNLNSELNCEEDVLIGRILRENGITAIDDRSRVDYPQDLEADKKIQDAYHILFKTKNRTDDCENMKKVHKLLNY